MPRNSRQQEHRYVEMLIDPIGRRLESVRQWLVQGSLVLQLLEAAGIDIGRQPRAAGKELLLVQSIKRLHWTGDACQHRCVLWMSCGAV